MPASRRDLLHLAGAMVAAGALAGCGDAASRQTETASPAPPPGPPVAASFAILASVISSLIEAKSPVFAIAAAGSDPHHFDPPPSAVTQVRDARAVLAVGLGFDPWVERLAEASGRTDKVAMTAARMPGLIVRASGRADPHVWSAPDSAASWIGEVARTLDQLGFQTNPALLLEALAAVAAEARGQIGGRAAGRRLVVGHDSFAYLGRFLGLEFVSLDGLSHNDDRGGAGMARLVADLRASGAVAAFPDSTTPPDRIAQLARDTGVTMGGTLLADTLTPPDGFAPDLPALLRHNVRTIATALG